MLANMSPEDIEKANQTQMLLEQGKAEAAIAGAELRQEQRNKKAEKRLQKQQACLMTFLTMQ